MLLYQIFNHVDSCHSCVGGVRYNLYYVDIGMYYCGLAIIIIPLSDSIMFYLGITTFIYVCGG